METATQTVDKKRTRAEVLRDRVQIRLALNEAGPLIAEVLKENGIELPGADWSKVFPHWLIACDGDKVIGCLQVMPAKPVGWCECLYVKPSAPFKIRALAIRKLIIHGMATCSIAGCSFVAGMVDVKNRKFEEVLKKVNFVRAPDHMMMVKRLVG